MNHLAQGIFHSWTFFHGLNQWSSLAAFAQKAWGFLRALVNTPALLKLADFLKAWGGRKFLRSSNKTSIALSAMMHPPPSQKFTGCSKKAHLLRCARSPRSNVYSKYASTRRFLARLASGPFLNSLESGFFNSLFTSDHKFAGFYFKLVRLGKGCTPQCAVSSLRVSGSESRGFNARHETRD